MISASIKKSPSALKKLIIMREWSLESAIKAFNLSVSDTIVEPCHQNVCKMLASKYKLLLRMSELEEAILEYKYHV